MTNSARSISIKDVTGVYTNDSTMVIQLCVDGQFHASKFPLSLRPSSIKGSGTREELVDSSGIWAIHPTDYDEGDAIVSLSFTSTVTGVTGSLTERIFIKRNGNEAFLLQIVGDPDDSRRNIFKLQAQSPVC